MIERRYFLVPGFGQTAGAWTAVIEALPTPSEAHAVDIPAMESFVATARSLAGGRSGIWAGYSLGGRLALQLALDCPDAVDALVLISTNPGIADPQARSVRHAEDQRLADRVLAKGVDAFLTAWLSQPLFADLDAGAARRDRLGSPEAIAHQLTTLGQGTQEPLWDRLAELSVPVVLVTGARDEKYRTISRRAAAAIGANARLQEVPEVGHNVLLAAPAAVARILARLR